MTDSWLVYDMLLDIVPEDALIEELMIGLTWTFCRTQDRVGLAMSPATGCRTLSWPGTLEGQPARAIATWVKSWDSYQAAVGMAVINASLHQDEELHGRIHGLRTGGMPNLTVFDYFHARLLNKKVVVVGRYPGLESTLQGVDVTVLEMQPGMNDLPSAASEYIIRQADWVFLTASSLTNKTFPRLAELAVDANLVLMGPTTPLIAEFSEFGVDYLAGTRVRDDIALRRIVMEGGGTRIFDSALEYCLVDLGVNEMDWIKNAISDTVAKREKIKSEMETWYESQRKGRFPGQSQLTQLDIQLSSLDSQFKRLWDARH